MDGLAVRDRLDGSPDFIHDKEEDDDDDDGGDSEDGDDGSDGDKAKRQKLKSSDTGKKIENQEHEFDRCMREFEKKYLEKKEDPPAPPPAEPRAVEYEHHSTGTAGDGGIYLSDIGELVKLDGQDGRVGPDGRKEIKLETLPDPRVTTLPKSGKLFRRKKEVSSSEEKKLREESEKLERERKKKEAEKKAKVSEKKGYEKKPNKRGERERDGGKNAAVCEDASDSEGESPGSHGLFRACRCEARVNENTHR